MCCAAVDASSVCVVGIGYTLQQDDPEVFLRVYISVGNTQHTVHVHVHDSTNPCTIPPCTM